MSNKKYRNKRRPAPKPKTFDEQIRLVDDRYLLLLKAYGGQEFDHAIERLQIELDNAGPIEPNVESVLPNNDTKAHNKLIAKLLTEYTRMLRARADLCKYCRAEAEREVEQVQAIENYLEDHPVPEDSTATTQQPSSPNAQPRPPTEVKS